MNVISIHLETTFKKLRAHYFSKGLGRAPLKVNMQFKVKYKVKINKRSVLRRQSRDTNRNRKRSVYCRYG